MKRVSILAALLLFAASSAGCGCCNWWRPAPVAVAPAYPPPAPVCDPSTTAPVTYGTPAPVAPYAPPPQW